MISPLRAIGVLLALLICVPTSLQANPTYNPTIKIKLSRFFPTGIQEVDITSPAPFSVTDQNGTTIMQSPAGGQYKFGDQLGAKVFFSEFAVSADPEEGQAGSTISGLSFTVHSTPGSFITVSGKSPNVGAHHYRGDILVVAGLNVINELPLEDYVKGVLKPEIGAGAPAEALKAQAVASRTYTVRNLGKMALAGADMDDTTQTETYLGEDGETALIDQAVQATAGEVLLYEGQPINALFCTDCGGKTAMGNASEPYLSPVSDSECAAEPPWQLALSEEAAQSLLASVPGASSGNVTVNVSATDRSGRVSEVKITQGERSKTVTGVQFRKMVGYDKLKSTLFKIVRQTDGSYKIIGQGWGHGLGLCQHGAIYLAQHSAACTDILRHYYTGALIGPLDQGMAPPQLGDQNVTSNQPQMSTPTGP